MFNKKILRGSFIAIALAALSCTSTFAARYNSTDDVLIVPARHTVIQLAGDIEALRGIALIAYSRHMDTKETVLHAWNSQERAWDRLTLNEYAMGTFVQGELNEMIIVGNDTDLPSEILASASMAKKVTRINTLSSVEIVNTLNKSMSFRPREWRALSERHGLKTKDLNYEKRRYGRYGPPKKEKMLKNLESSETETAERLTLELEAEMPLEEKGLELAPAEAAMAPKAAMNKVQRVVEESQAEVVAETEAAASTVAEIMDPADK